MHHTIVVSGWDSRAVTEAHSKAIEIFGKVTNAFHNRGDILVSPILGSIVNDQSSFFIAPDGSKEGWGPSNDCDEARMEFLDWLKGSKGYCDYVEVVFGGDDDFDEVLRSRKKDLGDEEED